MPLYLQLIAASFIAVVLRLLWVAAHPARPGSICPYCGWSRPVARATDCCDNAAMAHNAAHAMRKEGADA